MHWKLPERVRHLLLADTPSMSRAERLRSAFGASLAIAVCAWSLVLIPASAYWLMAPVGASVVVLFALSQSPLAQPWPVLGAYVSATASALVGMSLVAHPFASAALAVGLTVWLMARFNCIHPPGGALALMLVHEYHGVQVNLPHLLALITANVLCLLAAALIINNVVLRRRYPHRAESPLLNRHQTTDEVPLNRSGLNHADLAHAVRKLGSFVDVKSNDLVQLYNEASAHAFDRHMGQTCCDIMSKDVVTVAFATDLDEAWSLLRRHKIKTLPVVDKFGRLVGILSVADYLRQLDDVTAAGLAVTLQGLLRRTPGDYSSKAEVVGQIMTPSVICVSPQTPLSDLVQQLSLHGLHHMPVVDGARRVVGMVTHSDVTAALYRRLLAYRLDA
ncbi:MAG: CBS domain-containing protein [Aquabacterium sp.]|uniref:HPP family protein n=1 Tax=Aquabacterium sp. TaxID=1872578 RepID=UPI0025C02E0F|nr:CBS domain-containing protein [Aquabacterium sp.]MBI5924639.1 CBS domain-containing protein [Aquabacterium sp.]